MAYERINWQNEPSEATALNDVNFNKMDNAIYELDGKATTTETAITNLQNGKVDKVTGQGLSKTNDVQVTSSTNVGTEIATVQIFPSTGGVSGVQIKNGVVVDDALSSSSKNPVQNKVVKSALDNKVDKVVGKGLSQVDNVTVTQHVAYGTVVSTIKTYKQDGTEVTSQVCNGIVVDSALSDSSTNPVQNKVVKSAIDEKSTVAISDTLATGTTLANITIDGTTTAIKGSDIEVDEELSPTSTNPVENKAIYDALNNLLPSKTVSGNPISISDASGFNAKALKVTMNPIQDLHGYDHPWAGGAGKNKLPLTAANLKSLNTSGTWSGNAYTLNNVVFTALTDNDGNVIGIKVTGTASATTSFIINTKNSQQYLVAGTSYIVNGCPANGSETTYSMRVGDNVTATYREYGNGNTFTPDSNFVGNNYYTSIIINNGYDIGSSGITFYPMIRLSTVTDATFAPYSNICPISGRTEVSVTRTGKNKAPINDFTVTRGTVETFSPNLPSGTYSISFNATRTGSDSRASSCRLIYDDDTNYEFSFSPSGSVKKENITATKPIKSLYMYSIGGSYSDSGNFTLTISNFQIEEGSTATEYEPYNGYEVTIDLNGTRYGGTLDVTEGVLTVDMAMVSLKDLPSNRWNKLSSGTGAIYMTRDIALPGIKFPVTEHPISSDYNYQISGTMLNGSFRVSDALYIVDDRFSTVTEWIQYLATSDAVICYELATPTTISTSAENISLLKGNNVVSTDGDDIEMKYSVSLDSLLS